MRALTLLTVALLSAPASAEAPSFAVPDFSVVGGDARLAEVYAERLATALDARGLKVITQQAVRSMLSLERQKQLLGCSDESSSCVTELVGALGSTYVVLGQVAKVGAAWQVNVRTVIAKSSGTLTSFSQTVGSEDAALGAVTAAADGIAFTLDPKLAKPRIAPWVVAGVGLATAVVGSVFLVRTAEVNAKLRGPVEAAFTPTDALALANARSVEQALGIGLAILGGLSLGGGLLWFALGGTQKVSLAMGPTSAALQVAW